MVLLTLFNLNLDFVIRGFPFWLVKNLPEMQETSKIPWRRERLPTPVFWLGDFHGLYSPSGRKQSDTTEWLSFTLQQGTYDLSHSQLQILLFWLNRASPSLASKIIVNLILVLTIWWCPSVELSFVLLEEGVCYDQCILLSKLEPLPYFILYSKAKLACYCRYLLTSYFWIPIPYDEKYIFFWC